MWFRKKKKGLVGVNCFSLTKAERVNLRAELIKQCPDYDFLVYNGRGKTLCLIK